jgi:putative sterol carrier protein
MPRANSPQEIFDAMESRFLPEQARDLNAVVQFDLSGEGGGQWHIVIANGGLTVNRGAAPAPTMVFSASAADYVAIINGDLNPMTAFMQGKVRLRGDMALAMRLPNLFRRD